MTIKTTAGNTFHGTADELLAIANNIERGAARRGYSGALDREEAAEIRRKVMAAGAD